MKVLLTNDDSIHSAALQRLAVALLEKNWELFIAAPASEKSGIGRACALTRNIKVEEFPGLNCQAWAISGTPLDCVNIALSHLLKNQSIDLVISGINWGANVAVPTIFSSGTVAGAIEGVVFGIPSIALSQSLPDQNEKYIQKRIDYLAHDGLMKSIDMAARKTVDFAEKISKTSECVLHNINFPYPLTENTEEELTKLCNIMRIKSSKYPVYGSFYKKINDEYMFDIDGDFGDDVVENIATSKPPAGTDMHALINGKISHSIIDLNDLC